MRDEKGKLLSKPELKKEQDVTRLIVSRKEIPEIATEVLIKGKKCSVLNRMYDLKKDEMVIYTSYTKEVDVNLDESKKGLAIYLKEWNKQEIEKSPQMLAWCRLNKKKPEDVCVEDLRLVLGKSTSKESYGHMIDALKVNTTWGPTYSVSGSSNNVSSYKVYNTGGVVSTNSLSI